MDSSIDLNKVSRCKGENESVVSGELRVQDSGILYMPATLQSEARERLTGKAKDKGSIQPYWFSVDPSSVTHCLTFGV